MKILIVNNFYYNRGGDCTYLFSLKKMLEKKGHEVIVFSMDHPQNFECEYSQYFVSYINYVEEAKNKNLYSGLKVLFRSIYSIEAKKNIERLIEDEKPDIVHLNNIRHHVTPSILSPIKKNNIPIVWTLHDYQLICPNLSFLAGGEICERCKKRKYYWPLLVKCKKDSFLASTMAAIEHSWQMIMNVYKFVDIFICPSIFLKNKLIEYGFNKDKVVCLNNFTDINSNNKNCHPGEYFLYLGRLESVKGVKTLIDAVIKMKTGNLKIVGDGALREELKAYIDTKKENVNIDLLGHRSHEEVIKLIEECRFVVLPSEWYENFPYAILEAFACGKPVIGARIGGIPELVRDNETGLTFEPGNSDDLVLKITYLNNNPDEIARMGKNAWLFVNQKLSKEYHYEKLMEIYKRAASQKGRLK